MASPSTRTPGSVFLGNVMSDVAAPLLVAPPAAIAWTSSFGDDEFPWVITAATRP
ncbi:MAG TPA: hypothetical protein VIA18_04360 [Polyangia bacterium]|nr:hypothetical protein [Polyangia bacterium]